MAFRVAILSVFLSVAVSAQTQTASVRGAIEDATGASVPAATLRLTNVDQNRSWATTSNDAGLYVFLQIPPGNYTLAVEAPGFKKYTRSGLTLEVAMAVEINIPMEVGAVTESVQVSAETPLLETTSSTLGEVVNSITSENLPLNGRNVLQLVALTPGITTNTNYRNQTSGSGSIGSNGFSANGGRNVSSSILVDGSPQEVMGYNQPAYVPSPDAVQEFKVQTNSLAAEYGRTGGAVVNMVHRSGTSKFSGVLYEFLRNDAFDANGFFNNLNGRDKAAFRFNQFGATVGGPLTKSRQRSFFFFNYEGVRQVNPASSTFTVPTAKMRTGDFSEVAGIIYDPNTINAAGQRQPFVGNQIPAARHNPIGKTLLSYYPVPNRPGLVNNFFTQAGSRSERTVYSTKIDHRISENHNLFGRYSYDFRNEHSVRSVRKCRIAESGLGWSEQSQRYPGRHHSVQGLDHSRERGLRVPYQSARAERRTHTASKRTRIPDVCRLGSAIRCVPNRQRRGIQPAWTRSRIHHRQQVRNAHVDR